MTLTKRKKILIAVLAGLLTLIVIGLLLLLGSHKKTSFASPSPTPSAPLHVRRLSKDKFAPRSRPQNVANVDVGVRTVALPGGQPSASPTPGRTTSQIRLAASLINLPPGSNPSPAASPSPSPGSPFNFSTRSTPGSPQPFGQPTAPLPARPAPALTPPKFSPLPPPPAPQGKELVVVYAKGASGKRQVYIRSLERDKDEQLVSSVYDDFGVSLSSAAQKVAFYSNEEGPSDATKARTKLKVVDLANGKSQTIVGGLPGNWPVAWSPDGKKLAIPTANSIFIADVTTGTSLQVPTAKNPGGIVWRSDTSKFYYQAEVATDNADIFEAEAATAQAKPLASSAKNEHLVTPADDGKKIAFLRDQAENTKGTAIAVKDLASGQETTYSETHGALSYLWSLDQQTFVFVTDQTKNKISSLKNNKVSDATGLDNQTLVSFDRDYQHVFVLADDDQSKALFSVDVGSGEAEKVKSGLSENLPSLSQ